MLAVKSIPAFDDNYIWLIHNNDGHCVVVDPGDAKPVIAYLTQNRLHLDAILITHHHNDHVGGVKSLVKQYPNTIVYGPSNANIEGITKPAAQGQHITLLDDVFHIMALPGHTLDHIAYYTNEHLFCGDVLFSAGCGRVFEGSYQQMFESLKKIQALPPSIHIYPAHEYTLSNLSFALAVEPDNQEIKQYQSHCLQLRQENKPTLPTTLKREFEINPFLRTDHTEVKNCLKSRAISSDPLDLFAALREWKNSF
jgi:hydroxyacylglutathione hydrolase